MPRHIMPPLLTVCTVVFLLEDIQNGAHERAKEIKDPHVELLSLYIEDARR